MIAAAFAKSAALKTSRGYVAAAVMWRGRLKVSGEPRHGRWTPHNLAWVRHFGDTMKTSSRFPCLRCCWRSRDGPRRGRRRFRRRHSEGEPLAASRVIVAGDVFPDEASQGVLPERGATAIEWKDRLSSKCAATAMRAHSASHSCTRRLPGDSRPDARKILRDFRRVMCASPCSRPGCAGAITCAPRNRNQAITLGGLLLNTARWSARNREVSPRTGSHR